MAGDGKKLQPIIVKRVKKGGHAAHGGAWKIAYADFVTAMMAFFLLMWLLGSTTKGELKGIADYFNQPVKVSLLGGDGTGNSDSIITGGGRDLSASAGRVDGGDGEREKKEVGLQMAKTDARRQDELRIDLLQRKVQSLIANNPALREFGSQIRIERTQDGLLIQIFDEQNRPMFDVGSAIVKPYMRDLLREIGLTLVDVENRIVLSGHTDATPYGSGDRGYSNWELSADRANASRRELVAGGLPDDKLVRVEGLASSRLLKPEEPAAPANRRISLLVMTREAEERMVPLSAGASNVAAPISSPAPPASAEPTSEPAAPPAPESAPASRRTGGLIVLPDLQNLAEKPKPREELRNRPE